MTWETVPSIGGNMDGLNQEQKDDTMGVMLANLEEERREKRWNRKIHRSETEGL